MILVIGDGHLIFMNANKSLIFGIINRGLVLGRCGAGSGCRQLAEVADPARVSSDTALGRADCGIYPEGRPGVGNSIPTPWLFTIVPAPTPRFLGSRAVPHFAVRWCRPPPWLHDLKPESEAGRSRRLPHPRDGPEIVLILVSIDSRLQAPSSLLQSF